jgi:serine/threonine protein kinase
MAIPKKSMEKILETISIPDSPQEQTEMRNLLRDEIRNAEEGLHGLGYSTIEEIGQGGAGIVFMAEVQNPTKIKQRFYDSASSKADDHDYRPSELVARAFVFGKYRLNKKTKNLARDADKGTLFHTVPEAEKYFKAYSDSELEEILSRLTAKKFPVKGQIVAIKVSLNPFDNRFRQEKRVAPLRFISQPGSENVVAYFEYGKFENKYRYHVMEYVGNHVSLRQLPLLSQRLEAFMQALQAVDFLHRCGDIVHRDLKPENILVKVVPDSNYTEYLKTQEEYLRNQEKWKKFDITGRKLQELMNRDRSLEEKILALAGMLRVCSVKVTDFGLAKFNNRSLKNSVWSNVTEEGHACGTTFYMAPEQGPDRTNSENSDPRSDVYSLGSILYEIITGRNIYSDQGVRNFHDYLKKLCKGEQPTDPRILNRKADPYLVKIVSKALHLSPEERYHQVRYMMEDMQRWYDYRQKSGFGRFMRRINLFGGPIIPSPDLSKAVFER